MLTKSEMTIQEKPTIRAVEAYSVIESTFSVSDKDWNEPSRSILGFTKVGFLGANYGKCCLL